MRRARHGAGALAALAASGVLHAAGLIAVAPRTDLAAVAGGGGDDAATLGSAFEDLAAGAVPVVVPVAEVHVIDTTTIPARPAQPSAVTAAVSAPAAPALSVSLAVPVAMPSVVPAATITPAVLQVPAAAVGADIASPATRPPEAPAPETPTPGAPAAVPAAGVAARPEPPDPVAPVAPTDMVTASSGLAPEAAARPPARPEPRATVARAREVRPPDTAPAPAPAQAAGNAEADARRGSPTGQDGARAASSGPGAATAPGTGGAVASTYPGQVLRQITRLRRARTTDRGTVVVAFSIAASGGLASVTVAASSGSEALDGLALDHIRRAAPFPAPPPGAPSTFTFAFEGRP
jgi:protein TonB